jgi:serine/threonine protein kinase/WD40 repeat protein
MPSSDSSRDVLLERLAAEFVERHRGGEHPPLSEYTARYPDLAADIRELFPALVQIERLKPPADATGAFEPAAVSSKGTRMERLGDYRLVREVGRGGMGVVYEAEQESLGRHVALKVLPASALLSPTYLERFRREAKAAARLHHTNIVPVFGVGAADGVHFYAMQFIRGEGLDKVLADVRRLRLQAGADAPATVASEGSIAHGLLTGQFAAPAPEAPGGPADQPTAPPMSGLSVGGPEADYSRGVARLGVQVAEALAYAHRQGILHRDIKPSNLLLDAQGTVWVTDFGLAKAEGADELTHTGDIVGTIRFMAPERFEGKSLPQSDVYSLGVTLYELLTLRPAFDHTNKAKLIDRVVHEPPAPPRKIDPRIPRDLETVVLKCLAKDPAERYATAEALAEDLRRFLADRPIRARRTSWYEHTWRWCRRNPAVASLLGVVALLLLALTVGTLVANAHLRSSLEEANQANREKNVRLWQSKRAEARAVRMSARVGQRLEALRSLREALELPLPPDHTLAELRTEAIAALALPDLEVEKQWDGSPPGTLDPAFDARVEHYARITRDATVSLRRVADDAELARWKEEGFDPFPHNEYCLMLSPDGRYVAVYHDGLHRLRVRRVEGNRAVLCHEASNAADYASRAFSPDGARLVYLLRDGRIAVLELAAGQVRFLPKPLAEPFWLRVHPDDRQFAVTNRVKGQYGVEVRDLATGNLTARLPHPGWVGSSAWHPDGQTLATFGEDRLIRLWDVPSGKLVRVLEGHRTEGGVLAFDRQSGLLLSNDWNGILRVWEPSSGRQLLSRTGGTYTFLNNHLDGRVPSWDLGTGKLQVLRIHPARAYHTLSRSAAGASGGFYSGAPPVFSADGRLLFASTRDRPSGILIVDAASRRELNVVPFVNEFPFHWVPGGELLTSGRSGVLRWPWTANPDRPGHYRLGPPELLVRGAFGGHCGASRDGRTIAIPNLARGSLVWERDRPTRLISLQPQQDVRRCAVSPDGRWVAAFSHSSDEGFGIKVWDSRTGRLVKALPHPWGVVGEFSPDGRWLLTTSGGCRLWRTGTWEEGPTLGGLRGCFAPDGRSLAVEGGGGSIRLVEADSGAEVAHLEGPVHTHVIPLCFSPSGTQLVAVNPETETLVIWDLRALRQELQRLGLDWDAPPYPPAPAGAPLPRIDVDVVLGNFAPRTKAGR